MTARPGPRAAAVLALAGLAAAAGGCSVLPFRPTSGPSPPAPAEEAADDAAAAADTSAADSSGAPDSLLVAEYGGAADSVGISQVAGELPAPEVAPPAPIPDATPTPTPVPPADSAPPPAPDPQASDQVTVQISDAERAELETRARESLREARKVIRTIDRSSLSAERLEKLAAAESLVDQARAAFEDDVRAAATLAHKASVLLGELTAK